MKKYKQQQAEQSEIDFFDFCQQRKIEIIKLDDPNNKLQRQQFLIQPNGKCPDFLCTFNNKSIFL